MAKDAATRAVSVAPLMMRMFVLLLYVRANDMLEVMRYAHEGKKEDAKIVYNSIER